MSGRDSGNYTCDVSGPGSAILGIVRYTVHVKGEVASVYVWGCGGVGDMCE